MTFQPEKITKEHILKAAQLIDSGEYEITESTGYDAIINGKHYPPKDLMRFAHEQATGKYLWNPGGGEPTNKYIKALGFEVVEKQNGMNRLIEKAKNYTLSQDHIDAEEAKRLEFISKFPIDKLKDLTVDQYVAGTDENSFCYWLEFKKILFGIGGGNASKFGLYKAKDGNYITDTAKNKKVLTGDALNQQFTLIKDGIINALEFTKENNIAEISKLNIPVWNMVLQKILAIYFPEKFIMVGASDVIIECARDIKISDIDLNPNNLIQINYECRKKISEAEFFKDWGYEKIGTFIWQTYYDDSKRNYYILGSKYGDQNNIDVFPQMLEKSVVAVGFAMNLDLSDYYNKNHSEIVEYLKSKNQNSNSCTALKNFLSLKVGDQVAIKADGSPKGNEGFLSIIGIAEVTEKDGKIYEYDPNGLGHLIHVEYLKAPVYKEFNYGGYGMTMQKLNNEDYIEAIFKGDYENKTRLEKFKTWLTKEYKQSQGSSLTQKSIYSYINGIKFIDRDLIEKNYLDKKSLFEINDVNKLASIKESYFSKPEIKEWNEKGKNMYSNSFQRYIEYMDYEKNNPNQHLNINHKIDLKMDLNTILYGPPGTGKTYKLQKDYFDKFTTKTNTITKEQYFINKIGEYNWWQVIGAALLDLKTAKVTDIANHDLVKYKSTVSDSTTVKQTLWGQLQAHTIEECHLVKVARKMNPLIFNKKEDSMWEFVGNVNEEVPEIAELLNEYKNFTVSSDKEIKRYEFLTFHQSYSYEEFIEGIKPTLNNDIQDQEISYRIEPGIFKEMCDKASKDPENDYAIFIDEINRGNVSNIFGELITLIEDDKRLGAKNPMQAILPYSKKLFGVPKNLFIIGTMNTADRSVEALDTALRRRFSFIEMMPDYTTINKNIESIELSDLLFTINKRLAYLINEDHQIGHSYFISVDTEDKLRTVFKNNIIPLLKEYFYNDVSKIQLVLGEGFVKTDKANKPNFAVSDQDIIDKEVYKLELINDDFNIIEALTKLKIEDIA